MTQRELFDRAYQRVVFATKAKFVAEHAAECWAQVERFPESLYDTVATVLNGAHSRMPSAAEWREACTDEQARQHAARRAEHEAERSPEPTYACLVCLDSGFEQMSCHRGQYCTNCQRGRHLYDHRYVMKCGCLGSNHVIRDRIGRLQAAVGKGGRH